MADRECLHEEKLAWHLLPMDALEGAVRVLMAGARKYAPNNWLTPPTFKLENITDPLKRHLFALESGQEIDLDSGLPHTDHILCNAIFLTYYYKHDLFTAGDIDDRLDLVGQA